MKYAKRTSVVGRSSRHSTWCCLLLIMALHSELRADHMTCNVHHDVMCIVISGPHVKIGCGY